MPVTSIKSSNQTPTKVKIAVKRRVIILLFSVWFAYLAVTAGERDNGQSGSNRPSVVDPRTRDRTDWGHGGFDQDDIRYRRVLRATNDQENVTSGPGPTLWASETNCTPPAILDFPSDLFTQTQRINGFIVVHFIASIYVFYALAIICDDYFVPAIETICGELHMPSDVAGATFMAIATSSPELFTNVVGTFITEGDIGVGTIVGSAVFNVLAVVACCGFAAKQPLPLDWYPLTRDCFFYSFSVILLIFVLGNRQVFWYEALAMVLMYSVYILAMWKNDACRTFMENLVRRIRRLFGGGGSSKNATFQEAGEKAPLLHQEIVRSAEYGSTTADPFVPPPANLDDKEASQKYDEMLIAKALSQHEENSLEEDVNYGICNFPSDEGFITKLEWFIGWPARLVFTLTIPDCRKKHLRKYYMLTFLMCIVYIAGLTYIVSWLMTIIGYTFNVPDSVMGLTLIAAGTSVPEAVSSVIVARQGLGSMSISNSIGSNTFDILLCLGLPWLIRGAMIATSTTELNYIQINSGGLEFSTIILMISLVLLYIVLAINGFYLDKKVAVIATGMYSVFLVIASLFELNYFFDVNLPTCRVSDLI